MTQGKLESHGYSCIMGFMTPDEPAISTSFSPKRLFFDSDDASTTMFDPV